MCRTEPSTPLPLVSDSEIERTRNELTGQLEKQQAEWSRERKALTEELKDVHEACEQEMEKKAILIEQLDGLQQQYTVLEAKNKKELEQLTHKYELAFGAIQKEAETQKRELELLVEERFKQLHAGLDAMNQIAEKERKLLREKFFSQEQVEDMKKKITEELTSSLEAQRSTAQAANGQKECEKVKAATEKEWSGKLQSELARLRVELVGERDTSIRRLEEELETMRQKAEKAANADASGAAAKKEVKRLEEQLKESALQQLAQKRTIAALQTDVEALKIKLQSSVKSSRRSSLAPGRRSSVSPPPETESKRQLPKETADSLALWTARRLAAVGEYNVGLFNTIQQSCMAVVEKTTGTLHADVEAFQEESRRKAQSLDRTVSAMKMLQEDLRNKADQLRQREAELSEKEVHLEEVRKNPSDKEKSYHECCTESEGSFCTD
ncbi:hypothetical protein ADEAN_000812700 [Angomonas deanei]|uniref:Uncharacterized protein n=1 Tax=Angomonas deanei TaxID=59799 RepID=A0A7G2CMF7_9TRYP|nr:hypothetical protein ADEAN_000812700 [Angomonas deanei]